MNAFTFPLKICHLFQQSFLSICNYFFSFPFCSLFLIFLYYSLHFVVYFFHSQCYGLFYLFVYCRFGFPSAVLSLQVYPWTHLFLLLDKVIEMPVKMHNLWRTLKRLDRSPIQLRSFDFLMSLRRSAQLKRKWRRVIVTATLTTTPHIVSSMTDWRSCIYLFFYARKTHGNKM